MRALPDGTLVPDVGESPIWDGAKWIFAPPPLIPGPRGPGGGMGMRGPPGPPGPLGAASGDLAGNYPGPMTVVGFQGDPVSAAAPNTGDIYVFDGTTWVPDQEVNIFTPLAADLTFPSGMGFVDVINQPFAVAGGTRDVFIQYRWSAQLAAGTIAQFRLLIDGAQVTAAAIGGAAIPASFFCGELFWELSLPVGAHTTQLQCNTVVGTTFIRPGTEPNSESAALKIRETTII